MINCDRRLCIDTQRIQPYPQDEQREAGRCKVPCFATKFFCSIGKHLYRSFKRCRVLACWSSSCRDQQQVAPQSTDFFSPSQLPRQVTSTILKQNLPKGFFLNTWPDKFLVHIKIKFIHQCNTFISSDASVRPKRF